MNKLVATLATTTVLFAASAVYFAYRLHENQSMVDVSRSLAESEPAVSNPAGAAVPPGNTAPPPTLPPVAAIATPPAAAGGPRPTPGKPRDPQREALAPFAKDFLRQYDDNSQRDALLKSVRPGIESQYSRLKDRLKLDTAQFNKVLDMLAEEQLESQANYFRCILNPACDTTSLRPPEDHADELLALLGAEGYAQFTAYRKAIPEWQSVVQLRGRLTESNYLTDGNADRLVNALSAERERYLAGFNQAGVKTNGWGNGAGMVWYAADGGVAEQIASATQFSEAMRQRAAGVLSSEQLRTFVAIQDELLAGLASYLRSQNGG